MLLRSSSILCEMWPSWRQRSRISCMRHMYTWVGVSFDSSVVLNRPATSVQFVQVCDHILSGRKCAFLICTFLLLPPPPPGHLVSFFFIWTYFIYSIMYSFWFEVKSQGHLWKISLRSSYVPPASVSKLLWVQKVWILVSQEVQILWLNHYRFFAVEGSFSFFSVDSPSAQQGFTSSFGLALAVA